MEQLISVRSLFKDTDAYAGKEIKVGGWVRNLRASKNFGFIILSDGTFLHALNKLLYYLEINIRF